MKTSRVVITIATTYEIVVEHDEDDSAALIVDTMSLEDLRERGTLIDCETVYIKTDDEDEDYFATDEKIQLGV